MKKHIVYLPFYLLSLLPMWLLYGFSSILYLLIYRVFSYRSKVVFDNLSRAFPEKTENEIKVITENFYKYFTDMFMENMKYLTMGKGEMNRRLKINNPEFLQEYLDHDRSAIIYMAHIGNWEMMCGLPLYFSEKTLSLYQALSNSYMDGLIKSIRTRFGIEMVKSKNGFRTVVKHAREKEQTISCLVGDQCPHKGTAKHWGSLFGRETAFLVGTDRIARKTNQVVVYLNVTRPKRGHQEAEFVLLSDNPKELEQNELIDLYSKALETNIRRQPEIWLWSHKRWKYSKEDAPN